MTVVEETVFTNEAPAGTVVEQDIAEGTLVNKGDTITVKIAQPMDADNDGLVDNVDPDSTNPDVDGDGLLDGDPRELNPLEPYEEAKVTINGPLDITEGGDCNSFEVGITDGYVLDGETITIDWFEGIISVTDEAVFTDPEGYVTFSVDDRATKNVEVCPEDDFVVDGDQISIVEFFITSNREDSLLSDLEIGEGAWMIQEKTVITRDNDFDAPSLVGMTSEEAADAAAADESEMTVVEEIVFTNEAPAGTVVEQDIAEGTLVNKGDTITVKIAQPVVADGHGLEFDDEQCEFDERILASDDDCIEPVSKTEIAPPSFTDSIPAPPVVETGMNTSTTGESLPTTGNSSMTMFLIALALVGFGGILFSTSRRPNLV